MSDADADSGPTGPTDDAVVDAASDAAEGLVLSRYRQSEIDDLDVTVSFENGILEVDVYLNAPEDTEDPGQVTEDAVRAAEAAVDELFAESEGDN